jgi:hypothetical protein
MKEINKRVPKIFSYEWQHRGSAHIHGFLRIEGSPNMDTLDWTNPLSVDAIRTFFDRYVTTWNPCDIHRRNIMVPPSPNDDPFLLDSTQIFSSNSSEDYEHLVNRVQRHTKCTLHSCLQKNGSILTCRYNAPWEVCNESLLSTYKKCHKKYVPGRNNDRVNVHNAALLTMWHANVDCQPVVSRQASEAPEAPALCAYKRFLAETIVDRDIGAHET